MTDVVELDRVTVGHPGGPAVVRDFSWALRDGQAWAVVGPVASGKSTLAAVLAGTLGVSAGAVRWPLVARVGAAFVSDVVRVVGFREQSRRFSYAGKYYQQRFEFADADEPLTVGQFLGGGAAATAAADRFGLADHLDRPFLTLSNGQTRRARLARALLTKPELLVLDDPFVGLDVTARAELADHLGRLVADGRRVVLMCDREDVPGWATDVRTLPEPHPPNPPLRSGGGGTDPLSGSPSPLRRGGGGGEVPEPVVELSEVSVAHAGRTLLDRVSWTVRAGERWAVVGPNGSGKTTLLSLLCGDHPQAYAQDVRLFGRRRGTGETVWDVKARVGLTSPEFHLYFTEPLTADRVAATGFFDVLTDRPTTPEQDARVRELFAGLGLTAVAGRPFRTLSTGEQRLVLLARALVKCPPLVILDEPFQGLDAATARRVRDWLDGELRPEQAMLFVTHQPEEIPPSVSRLLRMTDGRACVSR